MTFCLISLNHKTTVFKRLCGRETQGNGRAVQWWKIILGLIIASESVIWQYKEKINQDKIAFWGCNHDYSKAIIIHLTDWEVAPQNMTCLVIESDFNIILLKDVNSLPQIQLHF